MARYSNPFIQYSNGNGAPLPGATLDFFEPGTTTPKDTFSKSDLKPANANPNPVVADGDGVMPSIFLSGIYKVVLKDAAGVVQPEGTKDPVGDTTEGQFELWLNDNSYDIPGIVTGSDDRFYRSITNANQGNDPTISPANWEELELGRIWNPNVTYSIGDSAFGSDGFLYTSRTNSNLNNDPTTDANRTNWREAINQERIAAAWVRFNGTGTVAINDSFNVSSITDNGVGDYTVTYQTAFLSTDYAAVATSGEGDGNILATVRSPTASNFNLFTVTASTGAVTDNSIISAIVFED